MVRNVQIDDHCSKLPLLYRLATNIWLGNNRQGDVIIVKDYHYYCKRCKWSFLYTVNADGFHAISSHATLPSSFAHLFAIIAVGRVVWFANSSSALVFGWKSALSTPIDGYLIRSLVFLYVKSKENRARAFVGLEYLCICPDWFLSECFARALCNACGM